MASPEQERNIKKYKNLAIISTIGFVVFLFCSFVKNPVVSIVGIVMVCISAFTTILFAVLMQKSINSAGGWKNTSLNLNENAVNEARKRLYEEYDEDIKRLVKKYKNISNADYGELGVVKFVNEGLSFSAEGKYACIKDYNDKEGFHFAFNICGIKLISSPEGYDDIIDYESNLFRINIGYFDDCGLSPENDNGVIVKDVSNLQGKTIHFKEDDGYMCDIETVEMDDIDFGEIEFVEWNEQNPIIKFKCIVGCGVSDIVFGKLRLTLDIDN